MSELKDKLKALRKVYPHNKEILNIYGLACEQIDYVQELESELENTRTQSQWISVERLKELCESYAKYSHLAAVLRVVPNYQNWLIEQGLSKPAPPKVGE